MRTRRQLVQLLATEIELAARRMKNDVEIEEALAHIELQISFVREITHRRLPNRVSNRVRTIVAPLRSVAA
jgi:hypothetical protein